MPDTMPVRQAKFEVRAALGMSTLQRRFKPRLSRWRQRGVNPSGVKFHLLPPVRRNGPFTYRKLLLNGGEGVNIAFVDEPAALMFNHIERMAVSTGASARPSNQSGTAKPGYSSSPLFRIEESAMDRYRLLHGETAPQARLDVVEEIYKEALVCRKQTSSTEGNLRFRRCHRENRGPIEVLK